MSKYGEADADTDANTRRQHHVNIELFNPIGLGWVGVELSNEKSNLFIWLGFMCIDAQTTTLTWDLSWDSPPCHNLGFYFIVTFP